MKQGIYNIESGIELENDPPVLPVYLLPFFFFSFFLFANRSTVMTVCHCMLYQYRNNQSWHRFHYYSPLFRIYTFQVCIVYLFILCVILSDD